MSINVPLWMAFAVFTGVLAASSAQGWLAGQYEVTRRGRFRLAVTRRWYGTSAQVVLRADAGEDDPDRFRVLQWTDEETAVPWLLVHRLDPEYLTYLDEDAEAFWGPVTDFAPFAVRRFRPRVSVVRFRGHACPVPQLTCYPPLPLPVRLPEGVRDAA